MSGGGGGSGNGVGPPVEFAGTMREELVWIENLMLAVGKGCLLDVNGPMFFGAGVRRLSDGGAGPGNGARLMEFGWFFREHPRLRVWLITGLSVVITKKIMKLRQNCLNNSFLFIRKVPTWKNVYT